MHDQEHIAKVQKVIEGVVRKRLDDVDIVSVEVSPDVDHDGDDILIVKVLFDGPKRRPDSQKTVSLVRKMRPKLAMINERAFPVISVIRDPKSGYTSSEAH
ncbi:MAG: hypothetical protein ACPGOY_14655 [Rhodospirillaceae bacterium]